MPTPSVTEDLWTVAWPNTRTNGYDVIHASRRISAVDEQDARNKAQAASRRHGLANVINSGAVVVTYVCGEEM